MQTYVESPWRDESDLLLFSVHFENNFVLQINTFITRRLSIRIIFCPFINRYLLIIPMYDLLLNIKTLWGFLILSQISFHLDLGF